METLIFSTSSGGAGNFAQRLMRDLGLTLSKPLLQRQFLSESCTTKYFFLFFSSTRVTPLIVLPPPKFCQNEMSLLESLIITNFRLTVPPEVRFNSVTSTRWSGCSPSAADRAAAGPGCCWAISTPPDERDIPNTIPQSITKIFIEEFFFFILHPPLSLFKGQPVRNPEMMRSRFY
jgi:hypothetical protein